MARCWRLLPLVVFLILYSARAWVPRHHHRLAVQAREDRRCKHLAHHHRQVVVLSATRSDAFDSLETYEQVGKVIRLAAKSYHPNDSKPSSRKYTTRKVARDSLVVSKQGAQEDYNHYRTVALKGTLDRALSIVTTDCLKLLRAHQFPVENGDLGENVLVDGVDFGFFAPGQVFQFVNQDSSDRVQIEITEPMEPCANLCKLPYINDTDKAPKERIETCKEFLAVMEKKPGLRGWYAKVLQEGTIEMCTRVVPIIS